MGAGLGRKGGVVRWSTATRMFVAWGLTLPAAALVGALAEYVTGLGDYGTALVAVFLIASSAAIWKVSRREVVDASNVNEPSGTGEAGRCGDRSDRRRDPAPGGHRHRGAHGHDPGPDRRGHRRRDTAYHDHRLSPVTQAPTGTKEEAV